MAPGLVRCGDRLFRASGGDEFHTGDEVVLCIRPRAVPVRRRGAAAGTAALDLERGPNVIPGTLAQRAYLGDLQELHVALPDGVQIRALTSVGEAYAPGEEVIVELAAGACLLVRP